MVLSNYYNIITTIITIIIIKDQQGEFTKSFFAALSPATKSKLFLSILGNHDYW